MITNPKSLIDMGFNSAVMASFTIPPPYGPVVAAGLTAGEALFNIFFSIPDRTDPNSLLINHNDLVSAVNELKQFIVDANFNSKLDTHRELMMTSYVQLNDVWKDNATGTDKVVAALVARGPLTQGSVSAAQIVSWKKQIDDFKEPILHVPSPILSVITFITDDKQHARQTLGLYVFTAGVWNMFCRLNVALEYSMALHDYNEVLNSYNIELTNFHTAHFAWKNSDKTTRGPEPLEPIAPIHPNDDPAFFNGSVFAIAINNHIGEFINYIDNQLTGLKSDLATRSSIIDNRLKAFSIKGRNGAWFYHDSIAKKDSHPVKYKQLADARMQAAKGATRLALWNELTAKYSLEKVKNDDVKKLEDILQMMRKTQNSVAPN